MARSKDDYAGCIIGFLVTVIIGSVVLTWFKDVAVSAWTATSNFFTMIWMNVADYMPMICKGLLVFCILWIIVEVTDWAITEVQKYLRRRKALKLAKIKEQDRLEREQAWRMSELGQNETQTTEVHRKLNAVKTRRLTLIKDSNRHIDYIKEMERDLASNPTRAGARFEKQMSNAKQISDDLDRQRNLCDGYIQELEAHAHDLRREKKSLEHFGSMTSFTENFSDRLDILKDVERFLESYHIKTYQGEGALVLSDFEKEHLNLLEDERDMRCSVENKDDLNLFQDKKDGQPLAKEEENSRPSPDIEDLFNWIEEDDF